MKTRVVVWLAMAAGASWYASDGSVLAAGAPLQNGGGRGPNAQPFDPSAPESGATYLFVRRTGKWSHAHLKAPNADEYDQFGSGRGAERRRGDAVAVNGEDSSSTGLNGDRNDNSLRDSGARYIY